jgi:hypothetical protein
MVFSSDDGGNGRGKAQSFRLESPPGVTANHIGNLTDGVFYVIGYLVDGLTKHIVHYLFKQVESEGDRERSVDFTG